MNQSSTILFLSLLLLAVSVSTTNAWTMPTPRGAIRSVTLPLTSRFRNKSPSKKDTGHYFRNGVEEDEMMTSIITITPPSLQQLPSAQQDFTDSGVKNTLLEDETMPAVPAPSMTKLRSMDLPKHSPPSTNAKMLWDMELVLGRTAMVMGVLMLLGEVFLGISPLVSFAGI